MDLIVLKIYMQKESIGFDFLNIETECKSTSLLYLHWDRAACWKQTFFFDVFYWNYWGAMLFPNWFTLKKNRRVGMDEDY